MSNNYNKNNNSSGTGGGLGICGVLQIIFIVLKVLDMISWTWWQVFIPTWIVLGITLMAITIALLVVVATNSKKL